MTARVEPELLTVHEAARLLGSTPCAVRTAIARHESPWARRPDGARGIPADFQQRYPARDDGRQLIWEATFRFLIAIALMLSVAIAVDVLPPRASTTYRYTHPATTHPECAASTSWPSPTPPAC